MALVCSDVRVSMTTHNAKLGANEIPSTSTAAVGTVDHDIHKQRRAALNPFFSKKSVSQLEPTIQDNIDKLCARLLESAGTGKPVNLSDAFSCLSADVISDCAFGETYGLLASPDFAPEWRKFMMVCTTFRSVSLVRVTDILLQELSLGTHLMKQFGWAYRLVMAISPGVLAFFHPLSRKLAHLRYSRLLFTIS